MEDGNIKEHRNYLQMEEEKRKRARVVRTAVEGPLIRWISRTEQTTVLVQPPVPPPVAPAPPPQSVAAAPSAQLYPYPSGSMQYSPLYAPSQSYAPSQTTPSTTYPSPYTTAPTYSPHIPIQPTSYYPPPSQPSTSQMMFVNYQAPAPPQPVYQPPPPLRPPIEKIETVAKNYVAHESSQKEGATKPLWKDTMTAMFGDHVRWDTLKVYVGKGRPLCEFSSHTFHTFIHVLTLTY